MAAPAGPRVLLVVNSLGLGGTERMIERTALALGGPGRVRYTVCALEDEGPIGARLRGAGVEVIALGGRGGTVRQVLHGARRVRRLLRERRFDLVHSFLYRSHCACRLARLGLRPRVPLISSERCLGDNRSRGLQALNRAMGRMSDRILAVSAAVADKVVRRDGVPEDRVEVVPNGIESATPDPRARQRIRRTLEVGDEETMLLFLGRLHREKGPDLFLDALSALRGAEGWKAVLVGDGAERPALERQAASLGLAGRVVFAGARPRVDAWLEASDVLVIPSREEGMPVAAIEAMMHARPVVATRVGGTPEVVRDQETGLLVDPEDAPGLARALRRLLDDPAARRGFGARGLEAARRGHSLEAMAEATLRQYQRLLPAAAGAPERSTAALPAEAD
jgi:glycosyltransferase involved in cell wall biosynthesis